MAQDDFVVKLPVGMEISGEAVGDLTHQLNSLDSKLPSVTIKVKSDGAKKVTDEINSLVTALKESGRTDFKVNLLGNRNGDIRKAVVEYTELSDGISRVIQQQYNLRDIVEKGELIGQFWEEGSKGVVKFTQGQDEAKAKTEATKKAMAELASEIAAVNKALSQSELEFARGNQNVSNLHFDDVAEKELRAQQKILALEKEGVITYEQAAEKLYELDEAITSAGEKADIFNAKIADKQYNQDFKKALTEQNEEQKRIAEEIARSERLAVAYREASWRDNIEKREAEEKRAAEERIAEEKRIAEEEKRISDEKIRNERLNASNYEAVWKEALAERETEEKRISDEQERRERLNAVYREARWKDNLAEREAEEKRIAEEQAHIENEQFKNQRLSASNYESWWAQALSERDSLEKRIAEEQANRERRNASNYVNWWTQALNEVDAKKEADDLSSEMTSWLSSDSRLSNSAYYSSEIEKLVDGLKRGDITADQARQSLSKLKDEAKKLGVAGKTMGKQVVDALKDIANIATVAEAVRMLYNATKQVIGNVRELDDVMVDLQIASGASADEVERMMNSYHDLAKEIGATSVEVAQAADGWLRQGYSATESAELIKNSTMLAKLGQMEAAEATDALTSAMKGYKLGVEEAESIVDKFAATDMSAAVSAGYLATAMSKTAVGAKEMGIDFDSLTGYIATVGEVTQDSAESVGTFFKTLIARMGNIKAGNLVDPETAESLSDVESVLNSLGIELRDGDENFRSFKAVLDDVHKSWEDYNDVQRQSIAVAFSGTRQQEKFKVLMANYSDAIKLAGVSASSAGTAMEKYNAYMDSITASTEKFKAAVYDFSDTFINSDLIKGVVDFGTAIVSAVTAVTDFAGTIPVLAAAFGLIKLAPFIFNVLSLSIALKTCGNDAVKLAAKLKFLKKEEAEAAVTGFAAATGTTSFAFSLDFLKKKMLGALATVAPYLVAIAAISAAIHIYAQRVERASEKTDELFSSLSETEGDIDSVNSQLTEISNRLEEIYELRKQDPDYGKEELNTLELQNEALRTKLELLEKERQYKNQEAKEALDDEIELKKNRNSYNALSYGLNPSNDTFTTISKEGFINQALEKLDFYAQAETLSAEDLKRIDQLSGELASLALEYLEWAEDYRSLGFEEDAAELEAAAKELNDAIKDDRFYEGSSATRKNDINKWLNSLGSETAAWADSHNEALSRLLNVDVSDLTVSNLLNEDAAYYEILSKKADEYGMSVDELVQHLVELGYVTDDVVVSNDEAVSGLSSALQNITSETDVLSDAIEELSSGKSIDEALTSEQITELIEKFPQLTDELRKYDAGLMSAEELQKQFNVAIAQFRGDQIADALQDVVDAAERYGDESNVVIEKIEELDKIIPGLSQALIDENGQLRDNAVAALSSAEALKLVAEGNIDLITSVNGMDLSKAREELSLLKEYAIESYMSIALFKEIEKRELAIQEAVNAIKEAFGSVKFPTSSSSASSLPSAYEKAIKELDHLRAMDLISEEQYYRRLEALADQYLAGKSKYIDEYRSVQEKLWAYQKELYERQRDAEIEAAENRADARKEALEKEYDAEKEALEKRKDLLEDEKDAYKDLIDYKKDLLDDASDERAHDQRVAELNQDIAQIEAELAAIALDNSAKANARRIELHDELLAKQKELEDEQWDWSVDNQKDALDEEYERYEKTIDAQIKLLEEQLDALEKSYDAQLDRIEDMLEANIAAINSSFDALINRAQDAANQIAAIFANINISSSNGIAELQSGLVGAGYNIGNYGANKNGVDGILGEKTKEGLQKYLNDLQDSGAIYFGSPLKIDGIIGKNTRNAIDAAIAAGYLNASFANIPLDKYHTGGIVGQKSGRNDLDIIKELVPLNDNEVWAKLLKKEMVLTEGQQEAVREAFRSVAAIKSATNTDVSKSRTLAGSVVQNNSPVFTIHNVFEGDVDADTLRRLDEWGNKFKKDVQNGVFKTMNQQNKFAGKTPVKAI